MMTAEISESNDYMILNLAGEVDYNSEDELKENLDKLLETDRSVVVDLSRVSYIDSVGISILTMFKKKLTARKKLLFFMTPQEPIRKIFSMTRLDMYIPVVSSLEEARKIQKGFHDPDVEK